jgi:hypothetical protein
LHTDSVFAALDPDHGMERIAGGNETEVYRSDDRRYVVKLKGDLGDGSVADQLAWARRIRDAAANYVRCLGPSHSIPSYYLIVGDSAGRVQLLIVQPYLEHARALHDVRYHELPAAEREVIALQLREIIRRSLDMYRVAGEMPDLYGRTSTNSAERARRNAPHMLPYRLWSFLVRRNLLRSHNLMLTSETPPRLVLVDYDPVRKGRLYRQIYYAVRWALFWRDHAWLAWMRRGGRVPEGE